MRPEDTEMASGENAKPEAVYMLFNAELIDAPNDVKALWAMQQVLDRLQLNKDERLYVLKFLLRKARAEEREVPW
jgi:hypothetical protein